MCTLSNRIREEPNWWEKIKDKATVKRWKEEALRQEAPSKKITPAMVMPRYLRTTPTIFTSVPRSTMYSTSSVVTRLCAIPRLG